MSERLPLPEVSSQSRSRTLNTLEHMMTRWRSGVEKMWRCLSGSATIFTFISTVSRVTEHAVIKLVWIWISSRVKFTGVAVRGSAGDHPLLCGRPRFSHQEPSHLSQGHRGHHSQPGAPGWGLDGRLQEDLLSPQQERCRYGQGGQCDLLTGCWMNMGTVYPFITFIAPAAPC